MREVSEDMGNTEDLIPPPGPASARQFHRFGKAGGAALCLALGAAACRAGPPVDVAGAQADARWTLERDVGFFLLQLVVSGHSPFGR